LNLEVFVEVKCLGIQYISGECSMTNGIKWFEDGEFHDRGFLRYRGFGCGSIMRPSRLILTVEVNGIRRELWIDRFWKKQIGRLTEKRRTIIQETMPRMISVEEVIGRKGTKYFTVSDSDLLAWLERYKNA
jgi:hypothetical protein